MRIIQTDKVLPSELKPEEKESVYNGLDCCVTLEVFEMLRPQLDNLSSAAYAYSRALQGPVLEMRLRGVLVDKVRKSQVLDTYHDKLDFLERNLERIVREGVGMYGFNWQAPAQKCDLFYNYLGIPVIKKKGRPTVERAALERMQVYATARPIIAHLLAMGELSSRIKMLRTEVDPDGRMRTSYNIAGTSTFRFSSSFSEFGTGGNLQNVEDLLRQIFISDPGMKLAYFDARQIQSRIVGAIEWNIFHDGKYLDACEGGDLHTAVARLVWPELPWTGDLKHDVELAEQPYYRWFSRRFMCKKIGHGTNFKGKPFTIAQQAKVEINLIQDFQPKYFLAFPAHLRWHAWLEREIFERGELVSICGIRRQFWGRRDSDETIREAVAYDPQCSEAFIVNNGMLQVWRAQDCQLLMQNHDAIIVQYPEKREDEIIPKIFEQLRFPVELKHGRELIVPYGCDTGWNWGKWSKDNPDGLKEYKPGDKRKRTPQVGILDRKFR